MTFNSSRLDSRKTRSDSKLDSNFGKKFGMQGPSVNAPLAQFG
jgi:hypothetical protein